jgi:DNA-binding transcriptional LysR family regulator
MELDQLRSFVAVAEARSFTRAASLVHLSQPAISRQIARLETELGARLFERYGRRVEVTSDGRLLLPLARNILARADDASRMVREHAGTLSSKVSLGSTGTVFAHLLAPILASFIKTYPKVHLDLVEREDVLLEEAVMNGELDCAIVTAWGSPRVATTHILTEEILLVIPGDHRLARSSSVSLGELADEPIVLPGHSMNMSNVLTDVCRRAGFEPKVPYRASYVELTKALVREGLGVALVPKMFLSPESLEGLVAISLAEHPVRSLDLIYLREHPVSTATRALVIHIRTSVSDQGQAEPD